MKALILIAFIFISCGHNGVHRNFKEGEFDINSQGIQTVIIDGCEYIVCNGHSAVAIVHKANCPNH